MKEQSSVFDFEKMGVSEKDAEILKAFAEKEKVFILLSNKTADFGRGLAVPYVGTQKDGRRILLMFTSLEIARAYINKSGYVKPEGNYMIGRLDKDNEENNLNTVCKAALQFGITGLYVDATSQEAFGCTIEYLFKANNWEMPDITPIESNEQMEKVKAENGGQIPYPLNMIPVLNFTNPFAITPERASELQKHIFNAGHTVAEAHTTFGQYENLNENVFLADVLNKRMIPMAKQAGKEQDVQYFQAVNYLLESVVWNRLDKEKNLFTLCKKGTDELFIVNDALYVLYTDFFESMGAFDYKKLKGKDELLELMEKHNVKGLIVTDGPSKMIVIEEPVINKK